MIRGAIHNPFVGSVKGIRSIWALGSECITSACQFDTKNMQLLKATAKAVKYQMGEYYLELGVFRISIHQVSFLHLQQWHCHHTCIDDVSKRAVFVINRAACACYRIREGSFVCCKAIAGLRPGRPFGELSVRDTAGLVIPTSWTLNHVYEWVWH